MAFGAAAASRIAALLGLAAIAGCVTPPSSTDRLTPTVSGRMSLRVAAFEHRPEHNFSAAFDLNGTAEHGTLQLGTPLGTTLAAAYWGGGEAVRLVTPDGEKRFPDLESMSREALGEALPLRALPDWLQGRPWPGAPSQADAGQPGFEQLGWHVDLKGFGDGQWVARRAAAPEVLLRVKLEPAP
jgi:outer membrane lipoprotein LolB